MKDTELLNSRLTKLQQDFDAQLSAAEQLAQENHQKTAELKVQQSSQYSSIIANEKRVPSNRYELA